MSQSATKDLPYLAEVYPGEVAGVRARRSRRARWLVCCILAGGATLVVPDVVSASNGGGASSRCPNANLVPVAENLGQIRAAVLCVINVNRVQRGLVALTEHPTLRKTALAHSSDMVARGYFAHTSLGGATFVERITDGGYIGRADRWSLGENLACGAEDRGTAGGVQRTWMRSRGHRATLLWHGYRDIGIGIELGVPTDSDVGATFTVDFGAKS